MENVGNYELSQGAATTAGAELRNAREAAGLTRADIAHQTKIAERHLAAIEEDRLGDLAARTYAVGFSRAYARALGLDESVISDLVRAQLDADGSSREPPKLDDFEPGDPARVPSSRLAWIAGASAIVVIGLLVAFWGSYLSPEGELPDLVSPKPAPTAVASRPATSIPTAQPTGPVVLTAMDEGIWVRVTDADGTRLVETVLKKGESWTVPDGAKKPELRTGRPDALGIAVGGKAIPALAEKPVTMSGVSLEASDLLARGSPPATPGPQTSSSPAPVAAAPIAASTDLAAQGDVGGPAMRVSTTSD